MQPFYFPTTSLNANMTQLVIPIFVINDTILQGTQLTFSANISKGMPPNLGNSVYALGSISMDANMGTVN